MKLFKEDTHNIKIQNFVTTFQLTLTIYSKFAYYSMLLSF